MISEIRTPVEGSDFRRRIREAGLAVCSSMASRKKAIALPRRGRFVLLVCEFSPAVMGQNVHRK